MKVLLQHLCNDAADGKGRRSQVLWSRVLSVTACPRGHGTGLGRFFIQRCCGWQGVPVTGAVVARPICDRVPARPMLFNAFHCLFNAYAFQCFSMLFIAFSMLFNAFSMIFNAFSMLFQCPGRRAHLAWPRTPRVPRSGARLSFTMGRRRVPKLARVATPPGSGA